MICMRPGLPPSDEQTLSVRRLQGHLYVPRHAAGIVVLADAHAGARDPVVDHAVLDGIRGARMATCEVCLLDAGEDDIERKAADVELLADRLQAVVRFLGTPHETARLPVALIGSRAAAPAALLVAAREPEWVRAVVCLSGEPDLAPVDLTQIAVPTILVVPGASAELVAANERAFWSLRCTSQLAVIRGANRRFTQSGTLLACRKVVANWCRRHVSSGAAECVPAGATP
jgi:putative phosphoribosyl transferase